MLNKTHLSVPLAATFFLVAGTLASQAATVTGIFDSASAEESFTSTTATISYTDGANFSTYFTITSDAMFSIYLTTYTPAGASSSIILFSGTTPVDVAYVNGEDVGVVFADLAAGDYSVQFNETGQLAGTAVFSVVPPTAVPLPAGVILLGSTLLGGLALGKRKFL